MKTNIFKLIFFIIFLALLVACSTKRDTFLSRNSHALSTRDNILYNGQIALDKGIKTIESNQRDNFWERLPIEKMQVTDDNSLDSGPKNPDFEVAEAKATKAIQKHSMNIDGRERNYQMDEAYLLLGKARYYDQRFFPALEAFNYILYKSPTSDKISQAKIWREKTNMRLGNDGLVLKNIYKLLKDSRLKPQVIADANALLAESFLNMEEKDSAIVKLKIADNFTKLNAERGRYRFILGQLYQELGIKDTALLYYKSVIDMNRKIDREYMMQAYAKRARLFDFENGDADAFVKKYNKLVDNRENRPFLDILYYEMGVFYDKYNDQKLAKEFYKASLNTNSKDPYLIASDYRNLGDMSFRNADYAIAAKYYDSTLVKLNPKGREYIRIQKVRKDLDEVIEFESIAKTNDSILNVISMSDVDKTLYYDEYIAKLKKSDEEKRIVAEKASLDKSSLATSDDPNLQDGPMRRGGLPSPSESNSSSNSSSSTFYFYNPKTVAFGKTEFRKKWGNRALSGNWRLSSNKTDVNNPDVIDTDNTTPVEVVDVVETPQYSSSFYTDQLPKTQEEIDLIAKERNFEYYQLGIIYKEKFKEYELASDRFERLLEQNPEEKLVLPTMYNLYKIYQITDTAKAEDMKNRITSQYPDSRYAQIINNPNSETEVEFSEIEYNNWYKLFQEEQFVFVLDNVDCLIMQYFGDEIIPKFELLKANTIGKLQGLEAYKNAMQFVLDNYPTTEEGKNALEILTTQIPLLEKMDFTTTDTRSWKILYQVGKLEDKNTKTLENKLKKFNETEKSYKLNYTYDIYTEKENFITIQGMKSENHAKGVALLLKADTKYKVTEPEIIISNDNYKVVQIRKNLAEYLSLPKDTPLTVEQKPLEQSAMEKGKAAEQKNANEAPSTPSGRGVIPSDVSD